jgi:hypothetical protein
MLGLAESVTSIDNGGAVTEEEGGKLEAFISSHLPHLA